MADEKNASAPASEPRVETTWDNAATSPSAGSPITSPQKRYRFSSEQQSEQSVTSPFTATSIFYDDNSFFQSLGDTASNGVSATTSNDEMQREINEFLALYQEKMKKWESSGEWVEVRETVTGKVMWYNSNTTRLVFDTPPNVEILNSAVLADKYGIHSMNGVHAQNSLQSEAKQYYLNRELSPLANENITGSLLNFDSDAWNFDYNNLTVYNYRLSASKRDHSKMLPDAQVYVFPEYFSLAPLPELLANKFLAKIQLPREFSKNKKYSLVQIKNDITRASDVIKAGVSKLDAPFNKTENPNDFIIKIVGQEAYMFGNKTVIEYEAVRHALRNEDDVEFALIKRTDFHEKIKMAQQEQKKHCAQFQTAYDQILAMCQPSKRETLSAATENDHELSNDEHAGFELADLPASSISLYEFEWHYRLKIEGLTNVTSLPRFDESVIKSIYVVAELWVGDMLLSAATLRTANAAPKVSIRWGSWLASQNLIFSQLPRESVLCLMVYGLKTDSKSQRDKGTASSSIFGRRSNYKEDEDKANQSVCLSWVRLPVICDDNKLRKGKYLLNMWSLEKTDVFNKYQDNPFRYRGTTVDKNTKSLDADQCQLLIAFDEHPFDVIAPKYSTVMENQYSFGNTRNSFNLSTKHNKNSNENQKSLQQLSKKQLEEIEAIIRKSPLEKFEISEKQLIWNQRDNLWHRPEALSAFVRSTNWTNIADVVEAHKYLDIWSAPRAYQDAVEFLDYKYMDSKLREKAVTWLNEMDDTDLQKYLLQLVQCLKFELHHENALSTFLVSRALKSPYQIGHYFFWHCKSEYDQYLEHHERFGLYLEEYLLFSCGHQTELFVQNAFLKRLEWISKKVTAVPEKKRFSDDTKRFFKKELKKVNHDLPNIPFQIPLYPRWKALRINIDSCKYMSSKKVPLYLVFANADPLGSDIVVMYKYGDDLRQDMLTLQIITLMDGLWLDRNLDLHLKPYKCLSTGNQAGMLEIVLNSVTVNNINENYGGVFNEKTIDSFIRKYNTSTKFLSKAKENFARSCAGYCIATYVLGISDRHPSNYMVCKNGQFFHIDFGHFLGNWKHKWGIKRERTPLVFTNQMRFAIANETDALYKHFLVWCCSAYNILRDNNRLLLILFRLMIAAGMEELVSESDILYFQDTLKLSMDEKAATKHIEKAIDVALKDWGTYVNNKLHQIRHQNKK